MSANLPLVPIGEFSISGGPGTRGHQRKRTSFGIARVSVRNRSTVRSATGWRSRHLALSPAHDRAAQALSAALD